MSSSSDGVAGSTAATDSTAAASLLPTADLETQSQSLHVDGNELHQRLSFGKRVADHYSSFGSYLDDKRKKLRVQYNAEINPDDIESQTLQGCIIWFNGRVDVAGLTTDQLRRLIYKHSGLVENVLIPGVTHIVANQLPNTKVKEMTHSKRPVVISKWITDSIDAAELRDVADYVTPELRARGQASLTKLFNKLPATPAAQPSASSNNAVPNIEGIDDDAASTSGATSPSQQRRTYVPRKFASNSRAHYDTITNFAQAAIGTAAVLSTTSAYSLISGTPTKRLPVLDDSGSPQDPTQIKRMPQRSGPSQQTALVQPFGEGSSSDGLYKVTGSHPYHRPHTAVSPNDKTLPMYTQQFTSPSKPPANNVKAEEQQPSKQADDSLNEDDEELEMALQAMQEVDGEDAAAATDDMLVTDEREAAVAEHIYEPHDEEDLEPADEQQDEPGYVPANDTKHQPMSRNNNASPQHNTRFRGNGPASTASGDKRNNTGMRSTLNDPDFVRTYFETSRLHFIGSFKEHLTTIWPTLLAISPLYPAPTTRAPPLDQFQKTSHTPSGQRMRFGNPSNKLRNVLHIDMDCFFVSASIRHRPELHDQPVAVSHMKTSAGDSNDRSKSTAEISSCNYPARAFGLKAVMTIGRALELCPNLTVVEYDFQTYTSVSEQIYRIFFSYTHHIQPISCDEAYIELPPWVDAGVVAEEIRRQIYTTTGCNASAGVGANKLLARLATKRAKPNGCYVMPAPQSDLVQHDILDNLPVSELQGVGWSLERKLTEHRSTANPEGIQTCSQLRRENIQTLKSVFGETIGATLYHNARGIDDRPVETQRMRKTLGADINWGIRFHAGDPMAVQKFIKEVATEVCKRLRGARVKGYTISIQAKKRAVDAPLEPPYKFLGHGVCDNFNKSVNVRVAIDGSVESVAVLGQHAIQLYTSFNIESDWLRGFGIHISKLEADGSIYDELGNKVGGRSKSHADNTLGQMFMKQNAIQQQQQQLPTPPAAPTTTRQSSNGVRPATNQPLPAPGGNETVMLSQLSDDALLVIAEQLSQQREKQAGESNKLKQPVAKSSAQLLQGPNMHVNDGSNGHVHQQTSDAVINAGHSPVSSNNVPPATNLSTVSIDLLRSIQQSLVASLQLAGSAAAAEQLAALPLDALTSLQVTNSGSAQQPLVVVLPPQMQQPGTQPSSAAAAEVRPTAAVSAAASPPPPQLEPPVGNGQAADTAAAAADSVQPPVSDAAASGDDAIGVSVTDLPALSELDRATVKELPLEFRQELAAAYKKKHALEEQRAAIERQHKAMMEQQQSPPKAAHSNLGPDGGSQGSNSAPSKQQTPPIPEFKGSLTKPTPPAAPSPRPTTAEVVPAPLTTRSTSVPQPAAVPAPAATRSQQGRRQSRRIGVRASELPAFDEIDPAVLEALPPDIRAELQRAYDQRKRNERMASMEAEERKGGGKLKLGTNVSKRDVVRMPTSSATGGSGGKRRGVPALAGKTAAYQAITSHFRTLQVPAKQAAVTADVQPTSTAHATPHTAPAASTAPPKKQDKSPQRGLLQQLDDAAEAEAPHAAKSPVIASRLTIPILPPIKHRNAAPTSLPAIPEVHSETLDISTDIIDLQGDSTDDSVGVQSELQQLEQQSDMPPQPADTASDDSEADPSQLEFAYEPDESLIQHVYRWVQTVATEPTGPQLQLLTTFCEQQLLVHRNLQAPLVALRAIRRYAAHNPSTWSTPFNSLLSHIQPIVQQQYQSQLPVRPLQLT